MTTKKTIKKGEKQEAQEVDLKYFYAIGRRKTSVARVKLFSVESGQNSVLVNDKKISEYFPLTRLVDEAMAPLGMAGEGEKFKVLVKVSGGGTNAQTDAVKLGIARSLVLFDETLKKSLKSKGYLTRDSREVERKKPGLKKARRAPQWAKR